MIPKSLRPLPNFSAASASFCIYREVKVPSTVMTQVTKVP